MVRVARRLVCGRCGKEVWICPRCERGQRYCSRPCTLEARRVSSRRAGHRFRAKTPGRLGNARRQRDWYRRRQATALNTANLTHHTSTGTPTNAILRAVPTAEGPGALVGEGPTAQIQPMPPLSANFSQSVPPMIGDEVHRPESDPEVDHLRFGTLRRCHFCGSPCRDGVREDSITPYHGGS